MYINNESSLISGLKKIERAALLFIIFYILQILFYSTLFSLIIFHSVISLALFLGASIVAVIIGFAALFMYLIPGFADLREYDHSRFNTPYTLIRIGIIGGLVLLTIALLLVLYLFSISILYVHLIYHRFIMAGAYSISSFTLYPSNIIYLIYIAELLIILSNILFIVGYVGIIIGLFRLKDVTGEDLFLVAAILYIVGIFIPFIIFIAWILILVAARDAVKRIKEEKSRRYYGG